MPIITEFREQFRPFQRDYVVKYENNPSSVAQSNIFSNPNAKPQQIEDFLVRGFHKLKWTGLDKFNKPKVFKAELQISFLRKVMTAVHQVMLLKGMDPTIMSVFYDLIGLEKKMVHRRKKKQKLTMVEVDLKKITLDNYIKA